MVYKSQKDGLDEPRIRRTQRRRSVNKRRVESQAVSLLPHSPLPSSPLPTQNSKLKTIPHAVGSGKSRSTKPDKTL